MKQIKVTYKAPNEPEKTIVLPYGEGTLSDLQFQILLATRNENILVSGTSEENWHRQHASLIEIIKQEVIP